MVNKMWGLFIKTVIQNDDKNATKKTSKDETKMQPQKHHWKTPPKEGGGLRTMKDSQMSKFWFPTWVNDPSTDVTKR